ncbi:hypothetical protein EG328_001775 [Venturia inaequalis]|uniref:GYF domain-containing protein n=1 Tax=Venturia inaequalis TaxID=5025 RepID=A0A8H3UYR2_VENIN|nr:hypothetical protein EG328_001775 [Venturia inaequalis]
MENNNPSRPRADSEATLVNPSFRHAIGRRNAFAIPAGGANVVPVAHAFADRFPHYDETSNLRSAAWETGPLRAQVGSPPGCYDTRVPARRSPQQDTTEQYQIQRRLRRSTFAIPIDGIDRWLSVRDNRQMVTPHRMRWVYKDPNNNTQGPWSGIEMDYWHRKGYLPPKLMIKRVEDLEFEPLAQLTRRLGDSRVPFLMPQVGVPHDTITEAEDVATTNVLPLTHENLAAFTGPPLMLRIWRPEALRGSRGRQPFARNARNTTFELPRDIVAARFGMRQTNLFPRDDDPLLPTLPVIVNMPPATAASTTETDGQIVENPGTMDETSAARDRAPLPPQNPTHLNALPPGYSSGPNSRISTESSANRGLPKGRYTFAHPPPRVGPTTFATDPRHPEVAHRSTRVNPRGSPIRRIRPRGNVDPSFRAAMANSSSDDEQVSMKASKYRFRQRGPLGFVMRSYSMPSPGLSTSQATADQSVEQTESHVQQTGGNLEDTRQRQEAVDLDEFLARLTRMPPPVSGSRSRHAPGAVNSNIKPPVPAPSHSIPHPSSTPPYPIPPKADKVKIPHIQNQSITTLKKELHNRDECIELLKKQLQNCDESAVLLQKELQHRDELIRVLEADVGLTSRTFRRDGEL